VSTEKLTQNRNTDNANIHKPCRTWTRDPTDRAEKKQKTKGIGEEEEGEEGRSREEEAEEKKINNEMEPCTS